MVFFSDLFFLSRTTTYLLETTASCPHSRCQNVGCFAEGGSASIPRPSSLSTHGGEPAELHSCARLTLLAWSFFEDVETAKKTPKISFPSKSFFKMCHRNVERSFAKRVAFFFSSLVTRSQAAVQCSAEMPPPSWEHISLGGSAATLPACIEKRCRLAPNCEGGGSRTVGAVGSSRCGFLRFPDLCEQ